MTIRWGASPIAWCNDDLPELGSATTLDQLLGDVRDIGFDGVELGNKFPRDPDVLAPIMEQYSLDIVGGWHSAKLLTRSVQAEIDAIAPHLNLLERFGCDVFIIAETSNAVHSDRYSRLDTHPALDDDVWRMFGSRLSDLAAYLGDRGVRTAYHYHLGTAVETGDELSRFLEVTDPKVGLVIDTGHAALAGIDPVALVRSHPERVAHVHCKGVRRARHKAVMARGGSFLDGVVEGMFTVPGDGDLDFAPFVSALGDIGYSGWIVIEAEQDPASASPFTYQQLGLDTLKRLAREAEIVS